MTRRKINATTFNVEKRKADDNLYPVEVIEKVGIRVEIHYTGYGLENNKLKEEKDIFETSTYTTDHIQVCPNGWLWK